MRSLLRFGARSTRCKDVFDIYYHLRIKGIDAGLMDSCMAKGVFGDDVFATIKIDTSLRRISTFR